VRIAVVDPGSFVLPYDFQLVKALAEGGREVDFCGSTTRYNGELLHAMAALPGVRVLAKPISSSVAPRVRGAVAYASQLLSLLVRSQRYDVVNLQFIGFWPLDWLVFGWLRRKFVFTVHNPVPHGFEGERHAPTQRLARLARTLLFVSEASRDDFLRRYGDTFRAKARVLPHGLMPATPQSPVQPYRPMAVPRRLVFWSRVQRYKGVELFRDLAQSEALRERGLSFAIHGAWAPELADLRAQLAQLDVALDDRYLDDERLLALLSTPDTVFLLPYLRATQSGALYTLLAHGRVFFCTDTGDLGAFMRRFGLEGLLLQDRSVDSVLRCLDHLAAHPLEVAEAFNRAQQALRWDRLLAELPGVY
jgi:glycosyltransferase involved in cell wall biosynthesis